MNNLKTGVHWTAGEDAALRKVLKKNTGPDGKIHWEAIKHGKWWDYLTADGKRSETAVSLRAYKLKGRHYPRKGKEPAPELNGKDAPAEPARQSQPKSWSKLVYCPRCGNDIRAFVIAASL